MNLIARISSSTWYLVLTFVGCLVLFHFLLVRWLKLGKVAWKRTEYIWLGFAALGLLGAAAEARRFVAQNQLDTATIAANAAYEQLRRHVEFGMGPYFCRRFTRSEYSPRNLDEIQKEFDLACRWYTYLNGQLLPTAMPNFPPFDFDKPNYLATVSDSSLTRYFSEFDSLGKHYRDAANKVSILKKQAERSHAEGGLIVIAPFLLAVALALRITKTTGEIRLET